MPAPALLGLGETQETGLSERKPSWRRTGIGAGIVVAVALGLGFVLTTIAKAPAAGAAGPPGGARGHAGRGGGGPGEFRPMTTVGTARVQRGSVPIDLSALGTVTAAATVNLTARVSGLLDAVLFTEGQMVRKGQTLAVIDPRPYQVAVQQAQGQLRRDQALLQTAKLDLARYETLRGQDSISGQTYDTQAALVRQNEATVSADQASVANAKLNLSFTGLTSPITGRVGLRQIDAGNQIAANQATALATIAQISPITVVFSLPQSAIASVIKSHGGAGLPVTLFDRGGGTVIAQGALATLDNQIDTTTGTVRAKARFANADGALFPNQFVNVVLRVDTLRDQVVVPTTAIRHGPQGDFAWVLQADRTVKSRPVTVGPGTAETVSITSGLSADETVITDGGDRLRDGGKVTLARPQGSGPGGAGALSGTHGAWRHHGGGAQGDRPAS